MDQKTIQKVATLARLELGGVEIDAVTQKLSSVLAHFESIAKVNTEGVLPMVTPIEVLARYRDDQILNSLTPEQGLANAPSKQGFLFKVPPVI